MINCNPETVSTDYNTPDKLYFDPLTDEDVIEIINREKIKGNYWCDYTIWWSNAVENSQKIKPRKNTNFRYLIHPLTLQR